MAVANTISTIISNAFATPMVKNDSKETRAPVYNSVETVEVAAADDDNSIYLLVPVRSIDRVKSLKVFSDAITGGTSYDFGLFEYDGTDITETNVDAYASAVDLSSAQDGTELAFEARDVNAVKNRVYQDAGLTEDNGKTYYIGAKANTVGTAAGTITLSVDIASY